MDNARKLFNEMPVRNVVSWTSLIADYAKDGRASELMQVDSFLPKHFLPSIIRLCGKLKMLDRLLPKLKAIGHRPDVSYVQSLSSSSIGCTHTVEEQVRVAAEHKLGVANQSITVGFFVNNTSYITQGQFMRIGICDARSELCLVSRLPC
ncbi:hypothetical protein ZIOFF_024040 [Zingiber officinale]|uniref:Pentatricopeptide repeat-containing protein n=1 Tax=Zingiber officinale TaxID=94328 RepID=A0A8J5H1Q5_ZINOF|nr:hypothetical protein ZIOFF_024040 [Zingiber officinale]